MNKKREDVFAAGEKYEPYVGRWSRIVAKDFVDWLALPKGLSWLDVGCGTGALSQTILERAAPKEVFGIDPSAGFIEYAKAHVPGVTFAVGDARSLEIEPASVDAAVAGLVLNFVPEPDFAIAHMARAVRPGGQVAAYVWDYAGKMELMRYFWDAAVALDPAAQELEEGRRFPLCHPAALEALFTGARLRWIEVHPIDVPTRFRDFDDYWTPFLGGQGPAPTYAMSLGEKRRDALRDRLRERLPVGPDGAIELVARAWAVRGLKRAGK